MGAPPKTDGGLWRGLLAAHMADLPACSWLAGWSLANRGRWAARAGLRALCPIAAHDRPPSKEHRLSLDSLSAAMTPCENTGDWTGQQVLFMQDRCLLRSNPAQPELPLARH
ncbi:hypothetical protein J1614_010029 [Plenodomus biglobosus]|nr:hypothetical protein J1614_010029 [Plenodomus biglobosus]